MEIKDKNKIIKLASVQTALFSAAFLLLIAFPILALDNLNDDANSNSNSSEIDEINDDIATRREKIEELNRQADVFKNNIAVKQKESLSLKREVSLLSSHMELTNLEITTTQEELDKVKLETEKIQAEIREKKDSINLEQDRMAELIRQIYRNDRKSYLEIVLLNDTFSDFFNEIKYLNDLDNDIRTELEKMTELKRQLEIEEEDLVAKGTELSDTKARLVSKKKELDEQIDYQQILLDQTQNSEAEYQSLLDDLQGEARGVQAEISSLEKRIRDKIEGEGGKYYSEFSGTFVWPVDSRVVSCEFHCGGYIYEKWLGPHPAVDIAVSQGSPVYAAADGYVAIARRLDWIIDSKGRKRPAYNYVNIIHNEELSTVYGHLSSVNVVEGDFVTKGQVIGYSGGLPGTAGAGSFSTGAHLHFETRKVNADGIPVPIDPMLYLSY